MLAAVTEQTAFIASLGADDARDDAQREADRARREVLLDQIRRIVAALGTT